MYVGKFFKLAIIVSQMYTGTKSNENFATNIWLRPSNVKISVLTSGGHSLTLEKQFQLTKLCLQSRTVSPANCVLVLDTQVAGEQAQSTDIN